MKYLDRWNEYRNQFRKSSEDLIKEALSKEIEMVDNIRDILVEYEDMGHDIQIWLYLIGNGRIFHIRYDKDHKVDYSLFNSDTIFKALDEYTSIEISIDFLDHDPESSGTKEDDEITDFLENFPKRINSEYPFVNMKQRSSIF
jgi:hypothetical protein